MSKQKLEGIFSKSLKERKDLWYIKLQVNPLAHTTSPADFIILGRDYRYLVECKQIDLRKNPKNRWTFSRLTQKDKLEEFEWYEWNRSFILILWLEKTLKKSHIYCIPIDYYNNFINKLSAKSLMLRDFNELFQDCKINVLKGSKLDLKFIK